MKVDWKQNADKIMAIAALATAVIAIVVAVVEARNQQEFQKLSVEPYIELSNTGADSIDYYAFLLINNGLGPAVVKSVSLSVDEKPVSNWDQAVRLTTNNNATFNGVYSSVSTNRRIKSSETVEVFKMLSYSDLAKSFHVEMNSDRVKYEVCYCSIYEECWRTVYGAAVTHEPVAACQQ